MCKVRCRRVNKGDVSQSSTHLAGSSLRPRGPQHRHRMVFGDGDRLPQRGPPSKPISSPHWGSGPCSLMRLSFGDRRSRCWPRGVPITAPITVRWGRPEAPWPPSPTTGWPGCAAVCRRLPLGPRQLGSSCMPVIGGWGRGRGGGRATTLAVALQLPTGLRPHAYAGAVPRGSVMYKNGQLYVAAGAGQTQHSFVYTSVAVPIRVGP